MESSKKTKANASSMASVVFFMKMDYMNISYQYTTAPFRKENLLPCLHLCSPPEGTSQRLSVPAQFPRPLRGKLG